MHECFDLVASPVLCHVDIDLRDLVLADLEKELGLARFIDLIMLVEGVCVSQHAGDWVMVVSALVARQVRILDSHRALPGEERAPLPQQVVAGDHALDCRENIGVVVDVAQQGDDERRHIQQIWRRNH